MAGWIATMEEMKRAEIGQYGLVYESGTTALTGVFFKIHCITETTFDTLTGNQSGDAMTGVAFAAGTIIYGRFTAITLTSGSILAYRNGEGV